MALSKERLERCVLTLNAAFVKLQQAEAGSVDYDIFRNAVIKGYELTLETAGKLIKKSLKAFFFAPEEVERLVFKDIFRHAAKHGLLTLEEVKRWMLYRENRNTTAHDYGKLFAEETLLLIPNFINDVEQLCKRLGKEYG